jgi:hypothetical protein
MAALHQQCNYSDYAFFDADKQTPVQQQGNSGNGKSLMAPI